MNKTEEFATRLAMAMAERGLNQQDIADYMEVSASSVSRWLTEGSGGSIPRNAKLEKLSSYLRVTLSWLLTGKGDSKPVNYEALKHGEPVVLNEESPEYTSSNPSPYHAILVRLLPNLSAEELASIAEKLQADQPPGWKELQKKAISLAQKKLTKLNQQ